MTFKNNLSIVTIGLVGLIVTSLVGTQYASAVTMNVDLNVFKLDDCGTSPVVFGDQVPNGVLYMNTRTPDGNVVKASLCAIENLQNIPNYCSKVMQATITAGQLPSHLGTSISDVGKTFGICVAVPGISQMPPPPPPVTRQPPILKLNGSPHDSTQRFHPYEDHGAVANDLVDGTLTSSIVTTGHVDDTKLGTYVLTYSVTNSAGLTTTGHRTVTVVTGDSPVITILGSNPVTITVGTKYVDAWATARDSEDGNIQARFIHSTNNVNTNVAGTYFFKYSVTDSAGNISTATRTIHVVAVDPITPKLPPPPPGFIWQCDTPTICHLVKW